MFPSVLKFFIASVALSFFCYASAQDCSCNDFAPAAKQANKSRTWGLRNFGHDVSQQKAAGLWAGYCNADCSITVGLWAEKMNADRKIVQVDADWGQNFMGYSRSLLGATNAKATATKDAITIAGTHVK
jgi:hypothetical protein